MKTTNQSMTDIKKDVEKFVSLIESMQFSIMKLTGKFEKFEDGDSE
ncbi:hypothetical protein [Bacillus sp. SJS]|nr:hypothetical protein [Bacillus sp. SJS]